MKRRRLCQAESEDEGDGQGKQAAKASNVNAGQASAAPESKGGKKTARKTGSGFMELPLELRNMIYHYALVDPEDSKLSRFTAKKRQVVRRTPAITHSKAAKQKGRGKVPFLGVLLLTTCRTIHDEAIALLYGQPLRFDDTSVLHIFLVSTPRYLAYVRDVHLLHFNPRLPRQGALNFPAFAMLSMTPNIKNVYLEHMWDIHMSPEKVAEFLYRAGHLFFDLKDPAGRYRGVYAIAPNLGSLTERPDRQRGETASAYEFRRAEWLTTRFRSRLLELIQDKTQASSRR